MISIENISHVMKDYYLDVVAEQINKTSSPFLAKIEQTQEDVWGREIHKAIAYGINGGIGAGTETGNLPKAGGNNYAVAKLTLKNLYGRIELSDKAIRASQNKDGSFVNLLNAEIEGLLAAAKFNMARMLYGHNAGVLADISGEVSVSGDTVICPVNSVRNFMEGMVLDGYSNGVELVMPACTVLGVDRVNKTVTVKKTGAGTVNQGGIFTLQGSFQKELTGLSDVFKEGTPLYGIDRVANPWFAPSIENGKNFSLELIQQTLDEVEARSGSQPDMIVCSADVRRMYLDELYATRRNVDYMNLDGGFKSLSYNGTPIVVERFAEEGSMTFLHTPDFKLYQLCEWRWLEGDDGRILKQIPGTPTYSATLVKYADLMCARPNAQARLGYIQPAVN